MFLLQPTLLQSLVVLLSVYYVMDLTLPKEENQLANPQLVLVWLMVNLGHIPACHNNAMLVLVLDSFSFVGTYFWCCCC